MSGRSRGVRRWSFATTGPASSRGALCRMLFTVRHGTFTSKRRALLWAAKELDPRWSVLILRAERERERVRGCDLGDLPRPELVEHTRQFADYATQWVVSSPEDAS